MEIRDPVHGFVHLTDAERLIIDSQPFQRLRNIRQLGMSYYVYPGATHTRFEHSIGAMYVADQMFNVLERKYGRYFNRILLITEDEPQRRLRKTLRLAALLHDIGHAPFSHATESLFPSSISHEEMGVEIIKSKLERIFNKSEIKRSGITLDDVIFLIFPEKVPDIEEDDARALYLLRGILSGDIDTDRIDYLTRDSHHTGVIYGKFDYMRLIDTITIVPYVGSYCNELTENEELKSILPETPEPRIGIEYGGIHTVEGLLLARYFMFLQVYFHPIRRIYDLMLIEFLKRSLPDGHYPEDLDEYLEYDDAKVLEMIKKEAKNGENREAKVLAERILTRNHPKKVFEEKASLLSLETFEEELKKSFAGQVQQY